MARDIDPISITFARFCIAVLIIGIVYKLKTNYVFDDFKSPWRFVVLGFFISLYFVLMFEGLKTAKPVSMSVVFTLTPLLAGLFDYLLSSRKMSKNVFLAVTIGALGAIWIIFEGDLDKLTSLDLGRGEFLFLIGCAGHAIYAALIPRLNRGETAVAQTFGTLIACSIILMLLGWRSISITDWTVLPPLIWGTIIYLAIFATAASFFLIQFSASRLSSVKVLAYTYAIPFWVGYFNWFAGGGMPQLKLFWGALVIVGVLFFLLFNQEH